MEKAINIQEAKKIIKKGFGKQLLEIACNCVAPFYWYSLQSDGSHKINNGTIFFIDTGERRFAVSAYHVYKGFKDELSDNENTKCQISDITFNPEERLIDYSSELDIVTFAISNDEVRQIGKRFLKGHQCSWPPKPPEVEKGIFFAGYPGKARILKGSYTISWGIFRALCVVKSIREKDISVQFEREFAIDSPTLMPEGYDTGGISGSPLITLVQNKILYWRLGGIVYEASHDFGILFARRADYILANGKLCQK